MGGEHAVHTVHTVHTMPLVELRPRAREARRLIAQAREIVRTSFDRHDQTQLAPGVESMPDEAHRVGVLLDAAQRLLPGIPSLIEERTPASRMKRIDPSARRVTLRGGEQRALETIERAEILEAVVDDATALIVEIARRASSHFPAAPESRMRRSEPVRGG